MIVSAKVVGAGVTYDVYSRQAEGVKRGSKEFVMSRSELTNFASNPKRWLDGYREDDDTDTDATRWGSLIECLAGLNGDFEERYAVAPAEYADEKTGKMKPWTFAANVCKAWREEQGDREVIKSELRDNAEKAVAALQSDAEVSELFNCSQKQVMIVGVWKDKTTGVEIPLRCLLDLVPDAAHPVFGKCLADFKTARNGSPDTWARVTDDANYDVQAALSLSLRVKATGEDRVDWIHAVQENVHPYHVVKPMPALTMEFIAYGRAKYEAALLSYARCLADGVWPSYPTRDRLVLAAPPCQLIGPDSLYSYRQSGGLPPERRDYEAPKQKPAGGLTDPDDFKM